MTKEEYNDALQRIVLDGLGFDAIRDLCEMLANYDANILACLHEMKAEQKAIRKICEGDMSNKEKIQTIMSTMD